MPPKTLYSLYSFYKKHFGYSSGASEGTRINFGKAISYSERVIKECYDAQDLDVIASYCERPRIYQLTENFLKNFLDMLLAYSKNPFYDLEHFTNKLSIDSPQNIYGHNKIHVRFSYLHNDRAGDFIVVVYGPADNALQEIGVFQTLASNFSLNAPLPKNIRTVHYWNVRDNDISNYDVSSVPAVQLNSILPTINSI